MQRLARILLTLMVSGTAACDSSCGHRATPAGSAIDPGSTSTPGELFLPGDANHLALCGSALYWLGTTRERLSTLSVVPKTRGVSRQLLSAPAISSLACVDGGVWVATYRRGEAVSAEVRFLPLSELDGGARAFPTRSAFPALAAEGDTLWLIDTDPSTAERNVLLQAAPGAPPHLVGPAPGALRIVAAGGQVAMLTRPSPPPDSGSDTLELLEALDRQPVSSLGRLSTAGGQLETLADGLVLNEVELATDGQFVYLMTGPTDHRRIERVRLKGGPREVLAEAGVARGLQVIDPDLYWFEANQGKNWNRLVRMPKAGGAAVEFATDPHALASSIVGDETFIYWTSLDGIRRKRRPGP